jgi:dimethylargininase
MIALVRPVSPSINCCELTHVGRVPIDLDLARAQHDAYVKALAELGCEIEWLPEAADLPDSVFVEDTAIVLDEIAVITRPGAPSRRAETTAVEQALRRHRPLATLESPATLDGGDVLRVGREIFVGMSGRSNEAAVEQLRYIVGEFGYEVVPVPVRGCLHLKSAVTQVAADTLLLNPAWLPDEAFGRFERVEVHASEPMAANGLLVGDTLVYPSVFPRTRERLETLGIPTRVVDVSELAKAEGAVTCCSLIVAMR